MSVGQIDQGGGRARFKSLCYIQRYPRTKELLTKSERLSAATGLLLSVAGIRGEFDALARR